MNGNMAEQVVCSCFPFNDKTMAIEDLGSAYKIWMESFCLCSLPLLGQPPRASSKAHESERAIVSSRTAPSANFLLQDTSDMGGPTTRILVRSIFL